MIKLFCSLHVFIDCRYDKNKPAGFPLKNETCQKIVLRIWPHITLSVEQVTYHTSSRGTEKTLFTVDLNNNKYNISCCKNLHIAVIYTELRVRFFLNVYSTLNKMLKTNDFASIEWHIQCKHSAKPTVCTCTFIFVVDCM